MGVLVKKFVVAVELSTLVGTRVNSKVTTMAKTIKDIAMAIIKNK